eukprot:s353_g3.t2
MISSFFSSPQQGGQDLELEVNVVDLLLLWLGIVHNDKERRSLHLVLLRQNDALGRWVPLIGDDGAVNLINQVVLLNLLPDEVALLAGAPIGVDLLHESDLRGETPLCWQELKPARCPEHPQWCKG